MNVYAGDLMHIGNNINLKSNCLLFLPGNNFIAISRVTT